MHYELFGPNSALLAFCNEQVLHNEANSLTSVGRAALHISGWQFTLSQATLYSQGAGNDSLSQQGGSAPKAFDTVLRVGARAGEPRTIVFGIDAAETREEALMGDA